MPYKTITVKLHSPSAQKKRIINDALLRYNLAAEHLLSILRPAVENNTELTMRDINNLINNEKLSELNSYGVEPFKDALRVDVRNILVGYLAQKQGKRSSTYPHYFCSNDDFILFMHDIINDCDNGDMSMSQAREAIYRLQNKRMKPLSLYFCRKHAKRDFSLLYNMKKDRFMAKLYLTNSENAISVNGAFDEQNELYYVNEQHERFFDNHKKRRYIIVPLEFGRWQQRFLLDLLDDPEMLKTARLQKRGDDYYLHLSLLLRSNNNILHDNYLGFVRSPSEPLLYYAVCDRDKNDLADGVIPLSANKNIENDIGTVSEFLLNLAKQYNARIVAYELGQKNDIVLADKAVEPPISRLIYRAVKEKLMSRSYDMGLQKPVLVSPRGVFYTCPVCGNYSHKNMMTSELFICTACGHTEDICRLAAHNLACRLIFYRDKQLVFHSYRENNKIIIYNKALNVYFETPEDFNYFDCFCDYLIKEKMFGAAVLAGEEKYIGDDYRKKYSFWKHLAAINDISSNVRIVYSPPGKKE